MIVSFDKSFEKSLDKVSNRLLFPKIEKFISALEAARSLDDLPNIKKLTGFKNYYRYRIGDYRIGMERISDQSIRLIVIAHRKDIYTIFP